MCKCCHCCSFDSLGCRLRTLKVFGAFLFLFGTLFALAGIAIGFLSDLYFQVVSLPDVFPEYILYAYLVITTGVVALGTGLTAIYIAKTMSDDDCSTRGLAILALLTIVCSLATVGVPAWPLYENGYFFGVPPQTPMNMTTSIAATTTPVPVTEAMSTMMSPDNSNSTAMAMNGTVPQMNATMNATSMDNNATVSSNSTSNETMSMDANMTMSNMTSDSSNMTMANMTSDSSNMTMPNMTSDSSNMTISNMTSENSTDSTSPADSNTTVTAEPPITTPEVMTGTTGNITTGNSTESNVTREPIDFDEWLLIITPFGIIALFAFIFVLFGLFIFCIACCCPERSEIVDDIDLYKS